MSAVTRGWVAGVSVLLVAAGTLDAQTRGLQVRDLIEMTRFGREVNVAGLDNDTSVVPAPDGEQVVVIVHRGNLRTNARDFALLYFRVSDLTSGRVDTLLTFSSTSNRAAIRSVRWQSDNRTLVFMAERPRELPQIYKFDVPTRRLRQETHATTVIEPRNFHVADRANVYLYTTDAPPPDTSKYAEMRESGFVVPEGAFIEDVLAGRWGYGDTPSYSGRARTTRRVHVVRDGKDTVFAFPDVSREYRSCERAYLSLASDGEQVLVPCNPRTFPDEWRGYSDVMLWEARDQVRAMLLFDLRTGAYRRLTTAPRTWLQSWVWSPDGKTVFTADALLPVAGVEGLDAAERERRWNSRYLAEVDIATGRVTPIARRDSLVAATWDASTNTVGLRRVNSPFRNREPVSLWYEKRGDAWREVRERAARARVSVAVREGLNTPWQLVSSSGRVMYDPNPGLKPARVTMLYWNSKAGLPYYGGLYWPTNYVAGRRYPLVIQAQRFDSTRFAPEGHTTSGGASQPLALAGVFVLQAGPFSGVDRADVGSPREGPIVVDVFESAIDKLDSLGLVDLRRLGMQGFSRTDFHTLYFLTHARIPLAAAVLVDGIDASYVSSMLFSGAGDGEYPNQFGTMFSRENGGPPFGEGLKLWMERAPGFNIDRVKGTAVQVVAMKTPLGSWERYVQLRMQKKPSELVFVPEGDHNLVRPRERLLVQQGAVDWFRFWLQAYENPAGDSVRYGRWRLLRAQRDSAGGARLRSSGRRGDIYLRSRLRLRLCACPLLQGDYRDRMGCIAPTRGR